MSQKFIIIPTFLGITAMIISACSAGSGGGNESDLIDEKSNIIEIQNNSETVTEAQTSEELKAIPDNVTATETQTGEELPTDPDKEWQITSSYDPIEDITRSFLRSPVTESKNGSLTAKFIIGCSENSGLPITVETAVWSYFAFSETPWLMNNTYISELNSSTSDLKLRAPDGLFTLNTLQQSGRHILQVNNLIDQNGGAHGSNSDYAVIQQALKTDHENKFVLAIDNWYGESDLLYFDFEFHGMSQPYAEFMDKCGY